MLYTALDDLSLLKMISEAQGQELQLEVFVIPSQGLLTSTSRVMPPYIGSEGCRVLLDGLKTVRDVL